MNLCVVTFKECWRDGEGQWLTDGGFPFQMRAIGSLFDALTLVVTEVAPRAGGNPLPDSARVVPLRRPVGSDWARKISVLRGLPYYLATIARATRQADVVHVPLPGDLALLGLIVGLAQRKAVIARYGGSWYSTPSTTLMNRVTRALMRTFAEDGHVMLATGEGEMPPASGIHWLFTTAVSSAELDRIRPDLDRGLSAPPRLIFAGRLSPEKGLRILIESVAMLRDSGFTPLPRVILAGEGGERARLTDLIGARGCTDLFRFSGQLGREALSRAFLEADICVQPSLTEGLSKAWIDAMAHGVPVLASRVGAARSTIGEAGERGWLVPPGDPRTLSHTLAEILTQPRDWSALRRRCRSFAEQRTLEAWSQRIGEICRSRWDVRLEDGKLRA